jgi:hypothetical protein
MDKYQYKYDVLVYKWNGNINIIDEIKEYIKDFQNLNIGLTNNDDGVIFISDTDGSSTSISYIYFGDYIVLDLNKKDGKMMVKCNLDMIKTQYKKII